MAAEIEDRWGYAKRLRFVRGWYFALRRGRPDASETVGESV